VSRENVERGIILLRQRRYEEAKAYFAKAAGQAPDDANVLTLLAQCEYHTDGQEARALETIERALALDPLDPHVHVVKAWILIALKRPRQALAAGAEAVRLDPGSDNAWAAQALAHLQLENWAEAEQAARQALEIDPENADAANALGEALRIQGRRAETAAHVAARLAKDPLDARSHASAGWAALQAGDRDRAEQHFVEALRLEPNQAWARQGLVEAFKARSPLYRAHLSYAFTMQRLNEKYRWAFLIGLVVGVRFLRLVLGPIGILIAILYFLFVFWTFLASAVANCLLLLDRRAQLALDRGQRWEGATVGYALFGGLLILIIAVLIRSGPTSAFGFALVGASLPLSRTFTNESKVGRVLFGSIAALTVLVGILYALFPGSVPPSVGMATLLMVVASTWLSNVPALRR
jgi:Tfp pilus assembly protein PilF